MNFLKRFAVGFAFAVFTLIIFGVPVMGLLLAAAYLGLTYGPVASIATLLLGICAMVGVFVAAFD